MLYPESILPKSTYIMPFPIDALCPTEYSVTRRIEGKRSECIEVVGGRPRLDPDSLGKIENMSVNLLGGAFQPEYSSLRQIGKGKDEWDGECDIQISDYEDCYEDTGNDHVFFCIDALHNADYPNNYAFEEKGGYKAYYKFLNKEASTQFQKGIEVPITVTLLLCHAPTNLNYWHFEVKTRLANEGLFINKGGSWRDMIFKHILLHVLCEKFTEQLQTTGTIAAEVYQK